MLNADREIPAFVKQLRNLCGSTLQVAGSRMSTICLIVIWLLVCGSHGHAEKPSIWFGPNNDTPDFTSLFSAPEKWEKARSQVDVLKFGPQQLEPKSALNSVLALRSVNAFQKLKRWNMRLAAEEGALKEWDCSGEQALSVTKAHIATVADAGGNIDSIATDSPLLSAVGPCHLSIEEAARRTAAYSNALLAGSSQEREIGDIEPLPHFDEATIKNWILALMRNQFKPSFIHFDIDMHYVDIHPEIEFGHKLKDLIDDVRSQGVKVGIIIWSGYDPISSDYSYYQNALRFARQVQEWIGSPDAIIFQSWVKRSPRVCVRPGARCGTSCGPGDPAYCGLKSIPLNLPEEAISHTRLINDALTLFR